MDLQDRYEMIIDKLIELLSAIRSENSDWDEEINDILLDACEIQYGGNPFENLYSGSYKELCNYYANNSYQLCQLRKERQKDFNYSGYLSYDAILFEDKTQKISFSYYRGIFCSELEENWVIYNDVDSLKLIYRVHYKDGAFDISCDHNGTIDIKVFSFIESIFNSHARIN